MQSEVIIRQIHLCREKCGVGGEKQRLNGANGYMGLAHACWQCKGSYTVGDCLWEIRGGGQGFSRVVVDMKGSWPLNEPCNNVALKKKDIYAFYNDLLACFIFTLTYLCLNIIVFHRI